MFSFFPHHLWRPFPGASGHMEPVTGWKASDWAHDPKTTSRSRPRRCGIIARYVIINIISYVGWYELKTVVTVFRYITGKHLNIRFLIQTRNSSFIGNCAIDTVLLLHGHFFQIFTTAWPSSFNANSLVPRNTAHPTANKCQIDDRYRFCPKMCISGSIHFRNFN